jgi:nitrous oxide reductase accessory protein NosL
LTLHRPPPKSLIANDRLGRSGWRGSPYSAATGLVLLLVVLSAAAGPAAQPVQPPYPGPDDTCPVCGMFVAKYPEWVASVHYQDGHTHHFDGAKDLFKYLRDLPRWAPGHEASQIRGSVVTEYYSLARINARTAWYVTGSDVLGPMGHELIPLESREAAEEFMHDHGGNRILRFDDVDTALLQALDRGEFR